MNTPFYNIGYNDNINGVINVPIGKNMILNLIPSMILFKGLFIIDNFVIFEDFKKLQKTMELLNVKFKLTNNSLLIDTTNITYNSLITMDAKHVRTSFLLGGCLLTLFNKALIANSTGCKDLQTSCRKVDIHIEGFKKMGVNVVDNNDTYTLWVSNKLTGTNFTCKKITVTGTLNLIFAAMGCEGITKIYNSAIEPEVITTINFLKKGGVNITVVDRIITIIGMYPYKPPKFNLCFELPSDRIIGGSLMILPLLLGGSLTIKGINLYNNLLSFIKFLKSIGASIIHKYEKTLDIITIKKTQKLNDFSIQSAPFPGIATDLIPFITILSIFDGLNSEIHDTIYDNRFAFLLFFKKIGLDKYIDFKTMDHVIIKCQNLNIHDFFSDKIVTIDSINNIRGAAALAWGCLKIKNIIKIPSTQINRGYYSIIKQLQDISIKINNN